MKKITTIVISGTTYIIYEREFDHVIRRVSEDSSDICPYYTGSYDDCMKVITALKEAFEEWEEI